MSEGIPWGEDLERDCLEMKKLESWGLYAKGHHDLNCPIHTEVYFAEYDPGVKPITIHLKPEFRAQASAEMWPDIIYFFINLDTSV